MEVYIYVYVCVYVCGWVDRCIGNIVRSMDTCSFFFIKFRSQKEL